MNAGDHYKIASLTKTYTAAVVLQLVAEGKLRLSDSIERWVPGLVPNGEYQGGLDYSNRRISFDATYTMKFFRGARV